MKKRKLKYDYPSASNIPVALGLSAMVRRLQLALVFRLAAQRREPIGDIVRDRALAVALASYRTVHLHHLRFCIRVASIHTQQLNQLLQLL